MSRKTLKMQQLGNIQNQIEQIGFLCTNKHTEKDIMGIIPFTTGSKKISRNKPKQRYEGPL